MRSSRVFWLALPLSLAACGEAPAEDRLDGEASVALTNVPADVQCLRFTVEGTQTVKRLVGVTPTQAANFSLAGLPNGDVIVSAEAFDQPCNTVVEGSVASWLSEGVPVTILPGYAPEIAIAMQRAGRGSVTVDFPDTPVINPAPSFASPVSVSGANPRDFDLADLNGDGVLDLVSLEGSAPDLYVRPGNAVGTFGAPVISPLGLSGARALALADWDGQSRTDVLVGFENGGGARLANGRGGLTFAPPGPTEITGPVARMIAFDFDADGFADVATSDGSGTLTVYRGTVQPYFSQLARVGVGAVTSLAAGPNPFGTATLAVGLSSNTVAYLSFDGADFGLQHLPLPGASAVALGRFSQELELMAAGPNAPISAATPQPSGTLRPMNTGTPSANLRSIAGADLNGDGLADLVGGQNQGSSVSVYRSLGELRLGPAQTLAANGQVLRVRLAQVAGDAKPDIIVSTTNGFSVFRNTSP
jgi:hypothetical protein